MSKQYQHLDLEKQSGELLRVARLQGQWTATKSFLYQAELLGEKGKVVQQMRVHLASVEKRLPYNPNPHTKSTQKEQG